MPASPPRPASIPPRWRRSATARPPRFAAADEALVYDFARALQQDGRVPEAIYAAAREAFGVQGVVELTALVGYYTMVSMTLNAHGIPLPEGEAEPLAAPETGLFDLPPRQA